MQINNPWIYDDMYLHNHVYYFIWKRKEPGDCVWIYNITQEAGKSPTETAGGYYSKEALIKTKFGK